MRQVLFALLFLVAFLAALAAGLLVVRREAAEMAVSIALNQEGISGATFSVTELDGDRARVEDLTLGRYGQVKAKSVEVRFSGLEGWNPLAWAPEIEEIEIDGLRLRLTSLSGSGLLDDPELDRLLNTPETEGEDDTPIPLLLFRDAEVTLMAANGASVVRFDGSVQREEAGPLAGLFSYSLEMAEATAKGDLQLDQEYDQPMRVSLTASRAQVSVKAGSISNLTAALTMTLGEDDLPSMEGEMTFQGMTPLEGYVEEASLSFTADPSEVDLDIVARDAEGATVGEGSLTVTRLDGRPRIVGQISLDASAASSQLGLTESGGALTLAGDLNATLPPLVELVGAGDETLQRLAAGVTLTSNLAIQADDVTLPGQVEGLSADLQVTTDWRDQRLQIDVPAGGTLGARALDPALLADLPDDTRQALSRDLSLTIPGEGAGGLKVLVEQDGQGLDITMTGPLALESGAGSRASIQSVLESRLSPRFEPEQIALRDLQLTLQQLPVLGNQIARFSLAGSMTFADRVAQGDLALSAALAEATVEDVEMRDLDLDLSAAFTSTPESLSLSFKEGSTLKAGGASLEGEEMLLAPAVFRLDEAVLIPDDSGAADLRLTALSDSLSLDIPDDDLPLNLGGVEIVLEGTLVGQDLDGWATVTADRVGLPSEGVNLRTLVIGVPLPPERLAEINGQVTIGSATVTKDGDTFSGMTAAALLTLEGRTYRLRGKGRGPGGLGTLNVSLDHDMETHRGKVFAKWGPITFTPDGLQPKGLTTLLEDLEDVSGRLDLEVTATWRPGRSRETANLKLTDMSLTLAPARFEGLSTDLTLVELSPPATSPEQQVKVALLDVGVPLTDVILVYQLLGGRRDATLDVERLQANFSDGRLLASPFQLSEREQAFQTTVEVDHIDLATLVGLLDLGKVEMSGRVIGQLPLAIDIAEESVAIEAGWLQSVGEGILRIPDAAGMLGLGDISEQQRELLFALDALSDFHYTYLYATVSFGADGNLTLALTIEGNSPGVLDGYPFKFNINIGIDLTDLLNAIRRGQDITPALFEGGWTLK